MAEFAFLREDRGPFGRCPASGRQTFAIRADADVPERQISLGDLLAEEPGPSAAIAVAVNSVSASGAATVKLLRIHMRCLPFGIDRPASWIMFMCPIGNAVTGRLTLGAPRSANSSARVGCTLPASSQARLCKTAGWPSQRQGERKRVKALLRTGASSVAGAQLLPPSAETMTLSIRPLPE